MQEPLERRVIGNGLDIHPYLASSKTHKAIVKQYERLHKGSEERTWSKIKFNAYKWGVVVPFMYGAVGGNLAKIWGDRLGVKRKTAVAANGVGTATTDALWLLASNEVIDTAFYVKLGITQGWNVYRLLHDEEENPKMAIGFETLAALAPYSKFLVQNPSEVIDEKVEHSKGLMKKLTPKPLKEQFASLKEYYCTQSFMKQQPVFTVAMNEGFREMKKSLYVLSPLIMHYVGVPKKR